MALLIVAALAALVAVVAVRGDDDHAPVTGEVVSDNASFEIGDGIATYRVVYRLDDLSDPAVAPSTDVVIVRRPNESRLETRSGAPPGDELLGVQIAVIDRLRLGQIDEPLVIARVPGIGASDLRIAPVLGEGLDAGLLETGEQRMVASRRCQVVRSGTLLGSGPLVPITDGEHADSCFDADGLLLEEVLFLEGKPTLHRIAVEVDTSPTVAADAFEVGDIVVPADQGGGSSIAVDPTIGALGPFWVLPVAAVPAGFEHAGRLSIVPPQPDKFTEPENPAIIAGTADVYVRGVDVVVLWQGGTLGRVDAYPPSPHASTIEAGTVGGGEQLLSAMGTELRFARPRGTFVHLIGTLAPRELRLLASALVETEGAGLVPHDG